MGQIHLRISDSLEKKYEEMAASGEFKTKSEAMRMGLIEFARGKGKGFMESGKSIGEHDREHILMLLNRDGALTMRQIQLRLSRKGIVMDKRHLEGHLFVLEKGGEIDKKMEKYKLT